MHVLALLINFRKHHSLNCVAVLPIFIKIFRFFVRAGFGYLKGDDLRRLLNLLGLSLPYRTAKELMHAALDASARSSSSGRASHPDRFYYRDLTDVEIVQPAAKKTRLESADPTVNAVACAEETPVVEASALADDGMADSSSQGEGQPPNVSGGSLRAEKTAQASEDMIPDEVLEQQQVQVPEGDDTVME